jgi:SAM-dependent methyltransferase
VREDEDAYGRLIRHYFEQGSGIEIVERDDGFIDASDYNPASYFAPYRKWPQVEREAVRQARGRVLDAGCGAGRVVLYLQERGLDVVGVDVSPLALEVARRRGAKDVRELSITRLGSSLGRFDTIAMFGNNFGLFGSPKRAKWLLRRFRSITAEDARILAESRNPYDTDAPDHLAYHDRNRQRGRMPGALRIRVRFRSHATPWFDYLIVSPEEMEEVVSGTGWELREVIDRDEAVYVGVLERA